MKEEELRKYVNVEGEEEEMEGRREREKERETSGKINWFVIYIFINL